ncbi:VOC family protein [Dactylosporangium sp. CA-092794]|uniref:VOC family protein n=1 Tax=Dactylosporangium sp. CA-092794 TaxID=3239929 RepID=UPI003D8C9835
MGILPAKLHHVGLVVRDIETIAGGYAELFGLDTWCVHHVAESVTEATIRGATAQISGRVGVGAAPWGDEFWLIEPGAGRSGYKDFQATNGHGIHHLAFAADPAETERSVDAFAALGVDVAQRYEIAGVGQVTELDTRELLGGYYVQLVTSASTGRFELPRGDLLDLSGSYARPDGMGPLPAPRGIQHFGVVVRDMVKHLDAYEQVFGIGDWIVQNWRTEPGSLESPTFEGRPVEHEYFAAASPFDGPLGFEVVQPTLGPSDYKENFLQVVGEGIHHLNVVGLDDHRHWLRLRDWLEGAGVSVCMSGTLMGGIAEFYYLDTRRRLGGIAIECFGMDPEADLTTVKPRGPYYRITKGLPPHEAGT